MSKDSLESRSELSENDEAQAIVDLLPIAETDQKIMEPEPLPIAMIEETGGEAAPGERRHIVKSATLVMFGNLGSSVMGMVRQLVVASFGSNIAGPFVSALSPAQNFNNFVINGHVNGALVPTFNDLAAPEQQLELRRLVYTMVNLILIIMLVASITFLIISRWFMQLVAPGYEKYITLGGHSVYQLSLTVSFAQIIFFSLLALGPFAVLQGTLYARKDFGWASVATALYHVGIILGAIAAALIGARAMGYLALPIGVVVGAFGELALLIRPLHRQGLRYMFVLDLKHHGLRKIVKLYLPIAFSFLVATFFIFLDQRWATQAPGDGAANYAAMQFATTLIQFPVGLVAMALGVAVLPTLTEHVRANDNEQFKKTLLLGFRLGLLLMIPAAAGLIVLGFPIVALIYRHGAYHENNALLTAIALRNYAYQLPFVAIDQLLLSAFYARKNTLTPVLVGVVSFSGYLIVAVPFRNTIGMPALAFANTVQNSLHPIILLVILRMTIGPLHLREILPTTLKICLATAAMVAVAWGLQVAFGHVALFSTGHLSGLFLTVIIVGAIAVAVYLGGIFLLKVEEVRLLKTMIVAKFGRR
jgi:putative peptidoglycan lipid II flippase